MLNNYRNFLFALTILSLAACSTKYSLVKSNRADYNINNNLSVDSSIIKTYLPYKMQLDAEMNKVIGYSTVDLTKQPMLPESLMGNFFADAVLHQSRKLVPTIDFAIPSTKGGLRNEIAKGDITVSNVFELMPFENELVLFTLEGSDVFKLLTFIARTNGQPVSGLRMIIKDGKPENISINGKAFDVTQNYQVLTSDYLASGGDGTVGFATPIKKQVLNLLIRDALLQEVNELQAAGQTINTKLDGRITKN